MLYLTVRTIGAILKGLVYLIGGFLFGALPLLAVIAWKVLKGSTIVGWKVTLWTIGAVVAGAALIARSL